MTKAYLGIDIGSISTKGVVIDENRSIIARSYLWTEGNPTEASKAVVRELEAQVAEAAEGGEPVDIVGAEALDALRRYNFTKAFLGAGGVTVREGFTVADPEDAAVKALAAARARQTYMLVDSSKFGRIGAASVLHIDEASVITDQAPGREFQDYAEVTVV